MGFGNLSRCFIANMSGIVKNGINTLWKNHIKANWQQKILETALKRQRNNFFRNIHALGLPNNQKQCMLQIDASHN
jgi:hypothetical protein